VEPGLGDPGRWLPKIPTQINVKLDLPVQYRNNLVNPAFGELYHASGAGLGYNNLNQMTDFARGVLSASGGACSTPWPARPGPRTGASTRWATGRA
jgi:hypothetical protein